MKKYLVTSSLIAILLVIPSLSSATPTDRQIVASKAYVDTKQDMISAGTYGANNSVVTYDSTTGDIQERWIYGEGLELYGDYLDLVITQLSNNGLAMLEDEEVNGRELTLSEIQNSVMPTKYIGLALAKKQRIIPYTLLQYTYDSTDRPTADGSVVVTTGAAGTVNQRGIATAPTYDSSNNLTNGSWLPTMSALMNQISSATDTLTWDSAETTSTNAYETKFVGDTGATAQSWPAIDKDKLVDGSALANALALKQNILPAKSTGNAAPRGNQAIVLNTAGYPSNVYTTAGKDLALTAKSGAQRVMNYVDGTTASATFATSQGLTEAQVKSALVSLELLKDVYSALHNEIASATPTGTANNVAMYDANGALGDGRPTADVADYNETTGELENGADIATIAAVETKQNIIPAKAQNSDFYSVLTDTSADGEVGKLQILTAGYMQANGESFASWVPNDNEIVTAGAIHRELLNNWQPIIPASMASNDIAHQTLSLPSFVVANVLTNGASPTLSSGTYGIITQDNIEDYAGLWSEFALLSNMDSAIPTVKAVANAITRLEWNSRIENAINAYRTQFFASGSDVWWFSEYDKLINTSVFSRGLALKQNKLVAKASNARAQAVTRSAAGNTSSAYITEGGSVGLTTRSGAPAVINYVNGTVATTEDMTTFTTGTFGSDSTGNQNYIKNALVSLELLKDVYSALHNEIASATPTGTANNVAMYDANGALGDGRPTADVADYNETTGELENGADIATIAAVETKQDKMVCAGYAPDHLNDPDYCWLWRVAE